jgi:hypothetical protein
VSNVSPLVAQWRGREFRRGLLRPLLAALPVANSVNVAPRETA